MERLIPRAKRWSGTIYRTTSILYANQKDVMTGAGAKITGGRWNPENSLSSPADCSLEAPLRFITLRNFPKLVPDEVGMIV